MSEVLSGSLEHWAEATPDAPTIVDAGWAEWNDQSNRLVHGLAAQGVVRGDIVVARTQVRAEWPIIRGASRRN